MIEYMDLFLPPTSQYQVLQTFTYNLSEALLRTGIRNSVLESKRDSPQEFVDKILANHPECTLSFNGLLPDDKGRFFSDMIGVPHVACLVDAPQRFISLTQNARTIITCVDRFDVDFFQGLNFKNVLFMPHAVDRNLFVDPKQQDDERTYDILMLASFIDYEGIREKWHKDLVLGAIWEEAAELILSDRTISAAQAIAKAIDKHTSKKSNFDPTKIDFLVIIDEIEDYINGKDRVDLLKAINGVGNIHVFGSGKQGWQKALKGVPNIIFHNPVPFPHAIKLMKQSKIVLNSCPSIKNGAHERIFTGIASGAAVLTNNNLYMHENFEHKKNILFYQHGHWEAVPSLIEEYLKDSKKRVALVEKGQEIVKKGHTWDHRAATLVNELGPILEKMSPV